MPTTFCCFIFFEECLNPQVRLVNKHIVDSHISPSEFTPRIHPLIFLWSPKGFISPEYFLDFFSNLYIPPWLRKSFKFMTLRWLENTFLSQKNWICSFLLISPSKTLPQVYIITTPNRRKLPISSKTKCSENLFFPNKEGEDYGAENMTKIKTARVLVTSFDKSHHLQP